MFINNCQIFNRNYRNRVNDAVTIYRATNSEDIACISLFDKIHCHYLHCYDIGHKFKNEDIINQQSEEKKINELHNDDILSRIKNEKLLRMMKVLSNNKQTSKLLPLHIRLNNKYNLLPNVDTNDQANSKHATSRNNNYHYGYMFKYGYDGEYKPEQWDVELRRQTLIEVRPKYSSLKIELTDNAISCVNIKQFNHECAKAKNQFNSKYCK
eukprot:217954_1